MFYLNLYDMHTCGYVWVGVQMSIDKTKIKSESYFRINRIKILCEELL